jgi:hypothetical protein
MSMHTIERMAPAGAVDGSPDPAPSWLPAATRIVDAGLWCVIETRPDGDHEGWEPNWLICRSDPEGIGSAVADWLSASWPRDARLAGYTRNGLRPDRRTPSALLNPAAA